jgi:hypothetical protein
MFKDNTDLDSNSDSPTTTVPTGTTGNASANATLLPAPRRVPVMSLGTGAGGGKRANKPMFQYTCLFAFLWKELRSGGQLRTYVQCDGVLCSIIYCVCFRWFVARTCITCLTARCYCKLLCI